MISYQFWKLKHNSKEQGRVPLEHVTCQGLGWAKSLGKGGGAGDVVGAGHKWFRLLWGVHRNVCISFKLRRRKINEFWVKEYVLICDIFISTQLEDVIFNVIFMEERSHEGQESLGLTKAIIRFWVQYWHVVPCHPSQCLYWHLSLERAPGRWVTSLSHMSVCICWFYIGDWHGIRGIWILTTYLLGLVLWMCLSFFPLEVNNLVSIQLFGL